ncbi:hypothetical protein D7V95_13085 [bacterium J10(2018)]|jgi:cytidyltransferase-like protein|nr:hypothetical protein D7V95_13085 [bacterium J10(2018)]
MTVIEQRTMDAIQSINRKMRDQYEPDWEQRRYEIALAMFASPHYVTAEEAVMNADDLIAELKKQRKKMIIKPQDIVNLRVGGKIVGVTSGCFDLLHFYHLRYLERCRALCDFLIVGVDSDILVHANKTSGR